jgi:hypothetical protein
MKSKNRPSAAKGAPPRRAKRGPNLPPTTEGVLVLSIGATPDAGGSGIYPFGPVTDRRRAGYTWLMNRTSR